MLGSKYFDSPMEKGDNPVGEGGEIHDNPKRY